MRSELRFLPSYSVAVSIELNKIQLLGRRDGISISDDKGACQRVTDKSCISRRMFFDGWIWVSHLGSALPLFVSVVASLAGCCSSIVQSDRVQCSINDDCIRRGSAFANSICVDELCESSAPPDPWNCLSIVL